MCRSNFYETGIYSCQLEVKNTFKFKKKLNEFAALLSITRSNFQLVTVKKQKYYVYRYEGKLNGIENAVVLLSYPEKAFGNPKALQAFLSTDVSLSVDETLSYYAGRWILFF